jgi:hypothetical protein
MLRQAVEPWTALWVVTLAFAPLAAADSLCDPSLGPTENQWGMRWGRWTSAVTEPPFHVGCPPNGQSAILTTSATNNGAILERLVRAPGGPLRRSDISFLVPSLAQWSHLASFPVYDPATLGRIGADVFHDPAGVDPDRLVIQFDGGSGPGCGQTNLYSWVPIPGNLQPNHWYRVSAQTSQRADGGLNVLGVLQDLELEDRPILVGTAFEAPASCTPAWYATEARWGIGHLSMVPTMDLFVDDFVGSPSPVSMAFQEAGGEVVIEAEHADAAKIRNGKSWDLKLSQTGFSGNSYAEVLPNTGTAQTTGYVAASPELSYRVKFSTSGTYYVWIRGTAPTAADDTVHVGLDGNAVSTADKITGFPAAWTWSRATQDGASAYARITVPSAGIHTIHLWMHEDGMRVDKILLRKSSSSTPPTGAGPAESPRVP